MPADLEPFDRRLLDRVQARVPLVPRPFAALAGELGCPEPDLRARLARLASSGVLRQIGGIFDTRACGYASALVGTQVEPARLEAAAAVVGTHPGVTHCYERDHPWNLWFTLAVPPASRLGLEGTVARLGRLAGAPRLRLFPALRAFKIAARFDLVEGAAPAPAPGGGPAAPGGPGPGAADVAAIRVLQRPLPLLEAPFALAGRQAGIAETELLERGQALLERGLMRRFAGLLNHRRAGFAANLLAVWAIPPERVEAAGLRIAGFPAVTHCYARPTYPDWPYSIFSMVHGRSRADCLAVAEAIRAAVGPTEAAWLWSLREFKKTRLQLFTPDYAAWERAA